MDSNFLLFVGTLNRSAPYFKAANGNGLNVYAFDEKTLGAKKLANYCGVENPTFLSVSENGEWLYANSEVMDWREGLVTAFRFDRASNELIYLNTQPTLGSITAHNMISRDGKRLFLANYTVGEGGPDRSFAVFDILADGGLSPAIASVSHTGQGPVVERQERAHAHSATEVLQGGVVLVTDLGTDEIISYRIDAFGQISRSSGIKLVPGSGPRHLTLHPNGKWVFVVNELNSTVSALELDVATGELSLLDNQPTLPDQNCAHNHCSDIQMSPDGKYLYCGNRGLDLISIHEVSEGSGQLTYVGSVPCGGETPRNLALTPSGKHLLVANQDSDRICIFARDMETGLLERTGSDIEIGTPMCLKFAN